MNRRSPLFCLAFALLMVGLMSCGGGGGGGGPTSPGPVVPSVAGSWIGTWEITNIIIFSSLQQKPLETFDITMNLSQTGGQVTGQATIDGGAGAVEGTVSSDGVFSFRVLDAEAPCATFNGNLTLSPDRQQLEGNFVGDSSSCTEDRFRVTGPMSLLRQ